MGKRINKNKIILLVVALITAILSFSIAVFGISYNKYNDKNSESSADLVISSVMDLKNFATRVREGTSYSGKTVQLKNDIDCSTLSSFDPIGTRDNPFKGTFDGNGKTISNLPLCQNDYSEEHFLAKNTWSNYFGLFECIDGATIKNLHIDNANWTHDMGRSEDGLWGGILVGYAKGTNNISGILITNSSLILSESDSEAGTWHVGGLIGKSESNCNIQNCGVMVNLKVIRNGSGSKIRMHTLLGGIAGVIDGTTQFLNNYYIGDIKVKNIYMLNYGGFVGYIGGNSSTVFGNMLQINNLELINEYYMNHTLDDYQAISELRFFANVGVSENFYSTIDSKTINCGYGTVNPSAPEFSYITTLKETGTKLNKLLP